MDVEPKKPPLPDVSPIIDDYCYCVSEVFNIRVISVCPNRIDRVTGVSPKAFFACTDAPQRTKNFASSSLGFCPQHICNAVSPFAFFTSKSTFLRLRINLTNCKLSVLTAKCNNVLS